MLSGIKWFCVLLCMCNKFYIVGGGSSCLVNLNGGALFAVEGGL